jgi:hypothetical protein
MNPRLDPFAAILLIAAWAAVGALVGLEWAWQR